jgi:solute carrier family 25 (mitochondrial iron transporter), member 28/37
VQYMLAGAAAGMSEHIAMYPVDTVKTRMQALAHPGQHLHGAPLHLALVSIIRREGVLRLYGGISAVAFTAG